MKRTFYMFLMMIFFIMISLSLYFATVYCLVYYRVVSLYYIIPFTDVVMCPYIWVVIAIIGALLGYHYGQKYWQIIYVDRVYYFDKKQRKGK